MMHPLRSLAALSLAALCAAPAFAQEPPPPVPPAGLEEEIKKEIKAKPFPLAEAIKTLKAGEYTFGLYLNAKNLGQATVAVTAGPTGEFSFKNQLKAQLGPESKTMNEEIALRADGSLRKLVQIDTDAKRVKLTTLLVNAEGGATRTSKTTPAEGSTVEASEETEAIELPNGMLPERVLYALLGSMEWKADTRYTIHSEDDTDPLKVDCLCTKQEEIEWRGEKLQAWRIELTREKKDQNFVAHVAKGKVLVWDIVGIPLKMVAGTKEQCAADLGTAKPAGSDETQLRTGARKFLGAFMIGKAAWVEEVTDYTALKANWAKHAPEVGMLTEDALKSILSQQVTLRGGQMSEAEAKAQLDIVEAALRIEIDGTKAKVYSPDGSDPLHFHKNDKGEWKFVWWSVFAKR